MMRIRTGLVALAVAAAPAAVTGQTFGTVDFLNTGTSFRASFLRVPPSSILSTWAGAPYSASFLVPDAHTEPNIPDTWGPTAFGPAVDILCIDFLHTAKTVNYDAWFTRLGRTGTTPDAVHHDVLTYTRGKDRLKYRQVAWLAEQMEQLGFSGAEKETRVEMHAAIWNLMTGEPIAARVGVGSTATAWDADGIGLEHWVAQAQMADNFNTVNPSNWMVVTDACVGAHDTPQLLASDDSCGQEFLVRIGNETIPEPATVILLGTGLIAMAGMRRLRPRV